MAEGITYPVVVDADHVVTELYAISNVPTVVLINEDDTIAMPNWSAYGSDLFSEFTGVDSGRQHDRIRRWVREGDAGMSTAEAIGVVAISPARKKPPVSLPPRLALRDRGDQAGCDRNFDRAAELAPEDWTIRRAMMPLRGQDPFGENFMALYADWKANGSPYHGVRGY